MFLLQVTDGTGFMFAEHRVNNYKDAQKLLGIYGSVPGATVKLKQRS